MVEFIKADKLKNKYIVEGRFYVLKSKKTTTKCRSLLTITDTNPKNDKKLLVVMLNPGSSRPFDSEYKETEVLTTKIKDLATISLTKAKPDTTQYQIMRVMKEFNYSFANIINLYDIIESKSNLLFDNAKKGDLENEASIFSDTRLNELNSYFTADTSVILAWGNTKTIKEIEKIAIDKVLKLSKKIFYVRGNNNIINHPSPLNHNLKIKWLENIFDVLRKNETHKMMRQKLNLITLGVDNFQQSVDFYEKGLGWEKSDKSMDELALFDLGGIILALHPRQELADDTTLPYQPSTFSGLTLSHNTRSEKEVDDILAHVAALGATIVKPAQKVYWGGYSGYFKDLDGHLFEVAYNPFWEQDEHGNVKL